VGLSFAQKFEEANKEKNLALARMLKDEHDLEEFIQNETNRIISRSSTDTRFPLRGEDRGKSD